MDSAMFLNYWGDLGMATVGDDVAMAVYNCGESCKSCHFWRFYTNVSLDTLHLTFHTLLYTLDSTLHTLYAPRLYS